MLTIGLTGGIGSGKSTAAELFKELGVAIIDTDIIAREMVAPNSPLLNEIINHFGTEIVNSAGELNRRKLRDIIFNDKKQRIWLEHHLHPAIYSRVREQLELIESPYCIIIIPLLLETKPKHLLNRILVVDSPENLQISRTQARDNTNEDAVKSIIESQVSRAERLAVADDVIDNSGNLEFLKSQVEKLNQFYLELTKSPENLHSFR